MKILSSGKEQKEENSFQKKSEFSTSSLIPELLEEQVAEVQTGSWLNQNYPPEQRSQIKFLEISEKGLSGLLDLTDFVSLEELYCYDNQLTGIKLSESVFDKLRVLHVGNNQFPSQDLSLFSRFIKLEVLNLGNNNFTGSLKFLKNLTNLRSLDISDTNIEDGLIYLSDQLESLFCRVEKKIRCRKISEELKDYYLGNDCYDFQAWKKDENWLVMPGAWPKNKANKGLKNLKTESLNKERKLFTLVNSIYQSLVLIEGEEKNIVSFLEKDIEEMQKEAREILLFDNFKDEFELDFNSLLLVAEKHLLANQKLGVLEEEIKKLRQDNKLLEEKNEFWKFLRLELTKQNKEIIIINSKLKNNNKFKNKNTMTNINNTNTNEKIYILEWKGADLKDGTSGKKLRYEKFEVVAGSEKEELKFYSTFFTGNNKFKKGEIYELSTPGNFVKDTSGTIPGGFDASGIIQGIDNGGYEFEKVAPSLMIKELWEEKESNIEKINVLEEDLQGRKSDINRINEKLISKEREFDDLKSRFDNLQIEKNNLEEEKEKISEELDSTKTSLRKKEKDLADFNNKTTQLQTQVTKLEDKEEKMKKEWLSPEEKTKLIQKNDNLNDKLKEENKSLNEQFKKERRNKQLLIETLEELRGQKLKETIEEKLTERKKELEKLEDEMVKKLGNDQKSLLENFLEKQEDFDTALFDDVSRTSRSFLRAKDKLQDARVKLTAKVGSEEVEELCRMQTEIGKLEVSKKQWEKMEDQQREEAQEQYESFTETPPTTPRN